MDGMLNDVEREHRERYKALATEAVLLHAQHKAILGELAKLAGQMERLNALKESVSLAHEERTGQPLAEGEESTSAELARAAEIMRLWDRSFEE